MTLSKQDHKAAAQCGLRNFKRNHAAAYIMDRLGVIAFILAVSYCHFAPVVGV